MGLVTHIFNEEMILPWFIKHHRSIFDQVIVIDQDSTDHSTAIIRALAPEWRIVKSKVGSFDAWKTDLEVMEHEKQLTTQWKVALNVTEFIWNKDFKSYLEQKGRENHSCIGMKSFVLVDDKERPIDYTVPIYKDRHTGYRDDRHQRRWRFVHKHQDGNYEIGRHGTMHGAIHDPNCFILYMALSPWPQCLQRKLQIQTRIPKSDIDARLGFEHITTEEGLREKYTQSEKHNLLYEPDFKKEYDHFMLQ